MMAGRHLTFAQQHNVYTASALAARAAREALEAADGAAFDVGPIADTLFRALALLGSAAPDHPCWADPDRRTTSGATGHA